MPEIIFIEGVSGVGKSTMCAYIKKRLENHYFRVRAYPEFDFTNPIDFYCTAYLRPERCSLPRLKETRNWTQFTMRAMFSRIPTARGRRTRRY